MKHKTLLNLLLALGLILALGAGSSLAQETTVSAPESIDAVLGTAFTYQGRVTQSGTPVTGTCSFQFSLWDAGTGGAQIGTTQTKTGVAVDKGYFTVTLDFGASAFNGDARYLAISVDCGGGYTALSPRAALNPAPYALALPGLRTQQSATSPNIIGGYVGNDMTGVPVGATISGGGQQGQINQVIGSEGGAGSFCAIGGGVANTVSGYGSVIGGGVGNSAANYASTVAGGENNVASGLNSAVAGGFGNVASGSRAAIAGGELNKANGNRAAVAGGYLNLAGGEGAFVGGGWGNVITTTASYAVIAGGNLNTASAKETFVGGGIGNQATVDRAVVAGGYYNTASANVAAVGGGASNTASGPYSVVPGGNSNAASGNVSLAAGNRAKAVHSGTFVWADATAADFSSTVANQFSVRATGGVRLETGSAGVQVNGNTVWHAGNDGSGSGLDADTVDGKHAAGFWQLGGNTVGTVGLLGTLDEQPLQLLVNNTIALRLEPNTTSPNVIGGYSNNGVAGGVYGATIGGGGSSLGSNVVWDNHSTVSGGYDNQAGDGYGTTDDKAYATVGGGYGNRAAGYASTVGGGGGVFESSLCPNIASGNWSTIGGGADNRAEGMWGAIAGGYQNLIQGFGGVIGGGEYNYTVHNHGVIGGGLQNVAQDPDKGFSFIGGGISNITFASGSTIGGGEDNEIQANGDHATIAGGQNNLARGSSVAIGGGYNNRADGQYSVVPGGNGNYAKGNFTLAAGNRAKADSQGCFVWGDSTEADVTCSTVNRTIFRSTGGYYIYTGVNPSHVGTYLSAGGTSWNILSNRALKENFAPVDTAALLDRLAGIEISSWNYRAQDPAIRHVGPMADEFNGLVEGLGGEGADHINSLDADGVALAAAQGLYRLAQAQQAQIDALARQNADLEARLAALEARTGGGSSPLASVGGLGLALAGLAVGVMLTRRGGWR